MAKFTIYVPDDLWDAARVDHADQNPSSLVQRALRDLVGKRQAAPAFARAPSEEAAMTMISLAAQLSEQANREFQSGYREALEFIDWLLQHRQEQAWVDLELLADQNWNVMAWIQASGDDPSVIGFFEGKNPRYAALTGEPDMPVISGAHMDGFVDALRSLWTYVREGKYLDQPVVTRLESPGASSSPRPSNSVSARSGPSDV
ncbi:MAG: hypothetical protein M0Z49_00760 [Chloroflexi bacterium]|nr:hypothetical protein [Chloroflexota bacterium]